MLGRPIPSFTPNHVGGPGSASLPASILGVEVGGYGIGWFDERLELIEGRIDLDGQMRRSFEVMGLDPDMSICSNSRAMTRPDTQADGGRRGILSLIMHAWAMLGFACAMAIIVMVAFGVLGTWGLYLGGVALLGGPAGFFSLTRRGAPVRALPLLLPFASMLVGALGLLVSGWTFMMLARH